MPNASPFWVAVAWAVLLYPVLAAAALLALALLSRHNEKITHDYDTRRIQGGTPGHGPDPEGHGCGVRSHQNDHMAVGTRVEPDQARCGRARS